MEDDKRQRWREKQDQRRERLREDFQRSRQPRHEPPNDPEEWTPQPWWKHSWQMLWDNPLGLLAVAIAVAIVLYILFPPSMMG